MDKEINEFLESHLDYLKDLILEITSICSPTGHEKAKAEYILKKLNEIGVEGAYIDEAGNVIYEHNVTEKATLYCAHIDTVFSNITEIIPEIIDNKIYAPSVADNSANIAGLLLMVTMFIEFKIELPVIFAFDVGEEGLGSLKGIKHVMQELGDKISAVVAVDGDCDEIVNKAVGSARYQVVVKTDGGHSWKQFGNPNAIAIAASIINEIYRLNVPDKITYNVGTIHGGTSVNSIAADTEFVLDLRSENQDNLNALEKNVKEIIKNESNAEMILLGERPCGSFETQTELEKRITQIRKDMGLETKFRSASTDGNIPISMKIPAITFGMRKAYNTHSIHEYMEIESLEKGIKQLAYFILYEIM